MLPPSPCSSIASRAITESWNTDLTLVFMIISQARSSMSCTGPKTGLVPALFTSTSTRPSSWRVASTRFRSSSLRRTLVGTASARRPSARTASAVSARASGLRAAIATSAPASARPSATDRPIPRLPPVTMATLPASEKSAIGMRRSSVPDGPGGAMVAAARPDGGYREAWLTGGSRAARRAPPCRARRGTAARSRSRRRRARWRRAPCGRRRRWRAGSRSPAGPRTSGPRPAPRRRSSAGGGSPSRRRRASRSPSSRSPRPRGRPRARTRRGARGPGSASFDAPRVADHDRADALEEQVLLDAGAHPDVRQHVRARHRRDRRLDRPPRVREPGPPRRPQAHRDDVLEEAVLALDRAGEDLRLDDPGRARHEGHARDRRRPCAADRGQQGRADERAHEGQARARGPAAGARRLCVSDRTPQAPLPARGSLPAPGRRASVAARELLLHAQEERPRALARGELDQGARVRQRLLPLPLLRVEHDERAQHVGVFGGGGPGGEEPLLRLVGAPKLLERERVVVADARALEQLRRTAQLDLGLRVALRLREQ